MINIDIISKLDQLNKREGQQLFYLVQDIKQENNEAF